MFNELLTGRTTESGEPQPIAAPPPPPPPPQIVAATCSQCAKQTTSDQLRTGLCGACFYIANQASYAAASAEDAALYYQQKRRQEIGKIVGVVVVVITIILLGIFKYQQREAYRRDMREAHGYQNP
jgi:hypothetical protein